MIQLPSNFSPKAETLTKLAEYQNEIDVLATFKEKSDLAKTSFSNKNKKGNAAFDDVKATLTKMCSGAQRCAYCEDSMADEVEHIYPKNLYPGKCFQWPNYLYACGPCNGPKNSKFAIFKDTDGSFLDVSPKRGEEVTEPVAGSSVLLDPRIEDGMEYCILDLSGTFKFMINPNLNDHDKKRADYTFNTVLRLNDQREMLRRARKQAFTGYRSRFFHYVEKHRQGATQDQLDELKANILSDHHPTVWKEIQRYRKEGWLNRVDAELDGWFDECPDAVNWSAYLQS